MAESLLERTKELCRSYNIKPVRSRGQNFLINEAVYDKIIEQADLRPTDTVLEVGPGLGFLTAKLAAKAGKVIAVELDDKLAEILETGLEAKGVKNIEVINRDILQVQPAALFKSGYKIVANLPYNITSIFLRRFLETENQPELMVLMLQKEVAERLAANPGGMSLLAAAARFYAEPEIIAIVPKADFWPEPKVDSAIVRLKIKPERSTAETKKNYFQLVKFGFSSRRKMLKNNLAAGFKIGQAEVEAKIKQAGFNPKIRAQELSVNDWLKLSNFF